MPQTSFFRNISKSEGSLYLLLEKPKRILKVSIKGIHPDMGNDKLLAELYPYIEHASSVRLSDRYYNGTTFYHGIKQVFVTHLTGHILRSLKIGNRWCLVFCKDQPTPPRRSPQQTSVIVETPSLEKLPAQMEFKEPGQDTSAENIF